MSLLLVKKRVIDLSSHQKRSTTSSFLFSHETPGCEICLPFQHLTTAKGHSKTEMKIKNIIHKPGIIKGYSYQRESYICYYWNAGLLCVLLCGIAENEKTEKQILLSKKKKK